MGDENWSEIEQQLDKLRTAGFSLQDLLTVRDGKTIADADALIQDLNDIKDTNRMVFEKIVQQYALLLSQELAVLSRQYGTEYVPGHGDPLLIAQNNIAISIYYNRNEDATASAVQKEESQQELEEVAASKQQEEQQLLEKSTLGRVLPLPSEEGGANNAQKKESQQHIGRQYRTLYYDKQHQQQQQALLALQYQLGEQTFKLRNSDNLINENTNASKQLIKLSACRLLRMLLLSPYLTQQEVVAIETGDVAQLRTMQEKYTKIYPQLTIDNAARDTLTVEDAFTKVIGLAENNNDYADKLKAATFRSTTAHLFADCKKQLQQRQQSNRHDRLALVDRLSELRQQGVCYHELHTAINSESTKHLKTDKQAAIKKALFALNESEQQQLAERYAQALAQEVFTLSALHIEEFREEDCSGLQAQNSAREKRGNIFLAGGLSGNQLLEKSPQLKKIIVADNGVTQKTDLHNCYMNIEKSRYNNSMEKQSDNLQRQIYQLSETIDKHNNKRPASTPMRNSQAITKQQVKYDACKLLRVIMLSPYATQEELHAIQHGHLGRLQEMQKKYEAIYGNEKFISFEVGKNSNQTSTVKDLFANCIENVEQTGGNYSKLLKQATFRSNTEALFNEAGKLLVTAAQPVQVSLTNGFVNK